MNMELKQSQRSRIYTATIKSINYHQIMSSLIRNPILLVMITTIAREFLDVESFAFSTRTNWDGWKLSAGGKPEFDTSTKTIQQRESLDTANVLIVDDNVGSGSYGTVHLLSSKQSKSETGIFVGKRPWQYEELLKKREDKIGAELPNASMTKIRQKEVEERAERCLYYWKVEEHCFEKLPPHPQLPPFLGTSKEALSIDGEKDGNEWMIFGFVGEQIGETPLPAPSLQDLMRLDVKESTLANHDLRHVAEALGTSSYEETLDTILPSLLTVLAHVHKHEIVHRDVKPANLLVHDRNLLLMDFGSAADLEPIKSGWKKQRVGLENGNRVAVSPVYAAPEIFIDVHEAPTAFDVFSVGLIFCQMMFGYLEERVDAGFRQQLVDDAGCDLNLWLNNELATKLRPAGLDKALDYLRDRPGLWELLTEMLSREPRKRQSARRALARWQDIQSFKEERVESKTDHSFFSMVIEALELCEIPSISRPLHFVATFSRSRSLGLILAEADDSTDEDDIDETLLPLWMEATKEALPGEVFVKGIVPDGQADNLGIFEIGDRLSGIGELPFIDGGFERAVDMLQDQPRASKNIRLHFDRKSVRSNEAISMSPTSQVQIKVVDRGAWSSKGRRKAQEDAFVLHEVHDATVRSVLIAGVMDGHGGFAASQMVSEDLPGFFSDQLVVKDRSRSVRDALRHAWSMVCSNYQQQCMEDGECIAEYDPVEGILQADTGSEFLQAGTTCSAFALDETSSELTVLNCGDSRSVVVSGNGAVKFATMDHTPQSEESRLTQGISDGLDYSLPKCRLSRWSLRVGDYEYAVGRSLEGLFATSKGIISDPDISSLFVEEGDILISATDGLWNVMDSEEVAIDLNKMRTQNKLSAQDAARALCSVALRKGTSDNVSVVVVYL